MENDTFRNKGSTENYTEKDIAEKAELFNTLNLSDKERFLKLVNPTFKDRIIAESMKQKQNNQTQTPFSFTTMAKNKNNSGNSQANAAAEQKRLDDAAVAASEAAAAEKAAETTAASGTVTTKKRAAMVLNDENPGHRIIKFLRYLKRIAASTDFAGFKVKKDQATSGEEYVTIQKRKFDGLMRRLYENKAGNITAAMHAEAAKVANRTATEFGAEGEGLADVAKRAEAILNEVSEKYESTRTGGPGRSAAPKLDPKAPPKNFFGGMKF